MDNVTLYYQERVDGGTRTGLEANDGTLLESFHGGADEPDPLLLWYVDVQCRGEFGVLTSSEAGREWLRKYGSYVRKALQLAADQLGAGLDVEFEPWTWEVPDMPAELSAKIVISAMRRVAALEVAKKLRKLVSDWDRLVQRLQALEAVPQV
jgi:hypothetical protein